MSNFVQRVLRIFSSDRSVFASALVAYRDHHGWGDAELAAWLRVSPKGLARLALCQRPDPCDPRSPELLAGIADYTGCNQSQLTELLAAAHTSALSSIS